MPTRITTTLLLGCLLLACQPARAISIREDVPSQEYAQISWSYQYDESGFLIDSHGQFCSATQIGPTHALTAAHCIDQDADGAIDEERDAATLRFGSRAMVSPDNGSRVASIDLHPKWTESNGDAAFDLAVLTFIIPRGGGDPRIPRISDADPTGLVGTMVGYGVQGYGNQFPGELVGIADRIAAQNMIDSVGSVILTDFDNPDGTTSTLGSETPLRLEGTTAAGDSGAALYADFRGDARIVGVLHGGENPVSGSASEYGDVSEWTPIRTPENLAFLAGFGFVAEPIVIPGDYNDDGVVDAADYTVWRDTRSLRGDYSADHNGNGVVDDGDYSTWSWAYGQVNPWHSAPSQPVGLVPEPNGLRVAIAFFTVALSLGPFNRR